MNADEHGFRHKELTEKIIGVFYEVYNELGCGFLESVYEKAMRIALSARGLECPPKVKIPIWFCGQVVGEFEPDLIVERAMILELKSARDFDSAHEAQLLNYLRATDIEVGLLLNFGPKPQIRRFLFDNDRKRRRGEPEE